MTNMKKKNAKPKTFAVLHISENETSYARKLLKQATGLNDAGDGEALIKASATFADEVEISRTLFNAPEKEGGCYIDTVVYKNGEKIFSEVGDQLEGLFTCPETGHSLGVVGNKELKHGAERLEDVDTAFPLYAAAARYFIIGKKPSGPGENDLVDLWNAHYEKHEGHEQFYSDVSQLMMDYEFSHLEDMESIEAALKDMVNELTCEDEPDI